MTAHAAPSKVCLSRHLDIAHRQDVEQVAIVPQIFEVDRNPAAAGLDDNEGFVRKRC